MGEPETPVEPESPAPEDPAARELRRARNTMQLGIGIGLMMAMPFAGYALKHYGMLPSLGRLFSAPKGQAFEDRRAEPAEEEPEQEDRSETPPGSSDSKSLGLVREGYFPELPGRENVEGVAAQTPEESEQVSLETIEGEIGGSRERSLDGELPPVDLQDSRRRRYPKLRKTKGFYDISGGQTEAATPAQTIYFPNLKEEAPKSQETGPVKETKKISVKNPPMIEQKDLPAAPPRPNFRRKSPSGGNSGATITATVQPGPRAREGGPVSIREAPQGGGDAIPVPKSKPRRPPPPMGGGMIQGPPDTAPEPTPERSEELDGSCPRRGWYKNSVTKLCYYSQKSCAADEYGRGECSRPNP